MAEKSVITNIEARIRQLIDDHKRLSESCAELTAQRDNLKAENRTLQGASANSTANCHVCN